MIAHRLSTIRNADKIIVMEKGEIVEEGDHDTLMRVKGTYFGLVEQQTLHEVEELELEQNEAAKILLPENTIDSLIKQRFGRSSIASFTPSVSFPFNGNKYLNTVSDSNENSEEHMKMIKVIKFNKIVYE